jgi:acyl-CoA synthetase (NDP forming)
MTGTAPDREREAPGASLADQAGAARPEPAAADAAGRAEGRRAVPADGWAAGPAGRAADPVAVMLEARSIALVGASPRPGTLGERMIIEAGRSPARPRVHLVNPRYPEIGGTPCYPSLADLPEPADLALLGVPDTALAQQAGLAGQGFARSLVIFGGAYEVPGVTDGLRGRLATLAAGAGLAVCGAGCMGFVNVARGVRATGYLEPDPLPAGPIALVTHSGSVFSALLRTRRALGFTLAVSSGQELVTTAAAYAEYALSLPQTRVLALVLEAVREPARLRAVLERARAADIPVVLLTAGASARGRDMVAAHSGALAGGDGGWAALADAYGVHRVADLAELADTLELFALGRRAARPAGGLAPGIATVHDSGMERAHLADLADALGVPFAQVGEQTLGKLARLLDPGLTPANPLDMWGGTTGAQEQLTGSLTAMADDPAVAAVALAVDLVPEFDGDDAYQQAVLAAHAATSKPVAVLANVPSAIDPAAAATLRAAGVPVLEGARTGLLALRHLLDHAGSQAPDQAPDGEHPAPLPGDPDRRSRWRAALAAGELDGAASLDLLRDYGIPAVRGRAAATRAAAVAAADALGYPVVLKTDQPGVAHKSDAGGVVLGLADAAAVGAAYDRLAGRLGPRVLVCETAAPGVELALGLTRDPALGPLLVVGAGGVLVELLADRVVALPPVGHAGALRLLRRLRAAALLAGARGQPPADSGAIARAITGLSALATELGEALAALDINPLICGPAGAVAVDALAVPGLANPELPSGT